MGAIVVPVVFLTLIMLIIIGARAEAKRKREEDIIRKERIANLKKGDKFVEIEWGEKYFVIDAFSRSETRVKIIDHKGMPHYKDISVFEDKEVYGPYYCRYVKQNEDSDITGAPI